jgi:hypothetical protein
MTPTALLTAFEAHNWMPGLVMLSLLVRTWLSDKSKFPVTLPVNWQPVVVAAATGFVNAIASLQAGLPASAVIASTLAWAASTGLLDGILVAMWGDPAKAPWWGRFIVMAFDDLEGRGSSGTPLKTAPGPTVVVGVAVTPAHPPDESGPTLVEKVPVIPSKPPTSDQRVWALLGATVLSACTPALGLPSDTDVAVHFAQQELCVRSADAGPADAWKAQVDTCRRANLQTWCAQWPAAQDCVGLADAGARDARSIE